MNRAARLAVGAHALTALNVRHKSAHHDRKLLAARSCILVGVASEANLEHIHRLDQRVERVIKPTHDLIDEVNRERT